MNGRTCWRCGRHIDTVRKTPTCDECLVRRDKRMAERNREKTSRLERALRLERRELARRMADREKRKRERN